MKMKNVQETPIEFTQTLSFISQYKDNQTHSNYMSKDVISAAECCDSKLFGNEELTYESTIREYLKNKLARSIINFICLYDGHVKFCKCNPVDGIGKPFITHFKTIIGNKEFTIIVLTEGDHDILKKLNCDLPKSYKVIVVDNLESFKKWYSIQLKLSEIRLQPVDTCMTKKIFGRTLGDFVNPCLQNYKSKTLKED